MFGSFFSRKKQTLHVIGDSHVLGFEALENHLSRYRIKVCSVSGATASGLQNPHSKTLAGPIIYEYVTSNVKHEDAVLLHLGEVDCGFLMWVRAEKNLISIEEQTELTLKNYCDLINAIASITKDVFILSILPQTIADGSKIENVANLRGHIKATQKQRTELSMLMNKRLEVFAEQKGVNFIDMDVDLIDEHTGIVKRSYLNEKVEDHHLSVTKLIPLLAKKFKKTLRK